MIHNDPQFQIYFGDARDKLHLSFCLPLREKLAGVPAFAAAFNQLSLTDLFFLHQIHGNKGYIVTQNDVAPMISFAQDGDYLVTDQPHIGLGTLTADCVPVICIDTKKKVAGIAHAGWKGAVAGVVPTMITALQEKWDSQLSDLRFFIGPSAKSCCYEVSPDFLANLDQYPYRDQLIKSKNNRIYFDVSQLVCQQLIALGVTPAAIDSSYNLCNMCHERFYSHRRGTLAGNAEFVGRQMTVVALK